MIDNIKSLPETIKNGFKAFFDSLGNHIINFKDNVLEFKDKVGDWFIDMGKKVLSVPDLILDGIKKIFIPEDGFIDSKLDELDTSLGRLGIGPYAMDNIFKSSQEITDVEISVMGSKGTIMRSDIVLKGIRYFRPAIRGFVALMLIFYNFNQFCSLIGFQGVSISGLFGGSSQTGIGVGGNAPGIEDKGGM